MNDNDPDRTFSDWLLLACFGIGLPVAAVYWLLNRGK